MAVNVDRKTLRILIIDDEAFIRSTIRQILAQIRIRNVYQADNVETGLSETLRIEPHVVLCDVHMPYAGGLDYLSALRNAVIPSVAATPVIMLTSDGTKGTVLTAKDRNISGYLLKPVSAAAVQNAIERAVGITLA